MIGEISALGCALCWAASSTLTKSLAGKFNPLNLNLLRCAAASILLWGIIPFTPGTQALVQAPGVSLLFLALSALIGIAVGDTLYIRGLRLINVTLAFPISQSAMPLFTLAVAIIFLGEEITWSLSLGTGLVLGGIYLITEPGWRRRHPQTNPPAENRRTGISLVICASLLWAISISLLKVGLQGVSLILANGVRLPLAVLVLLFLILFQKPLPQPTTPKFRDVALVAITGLLGFGLGGILFLQAILYSGAAKATVLTSAAPLFGLPLSLLFLKERVTGSVIAGTVLGVLGIGFIV
ncbi:MAG: DMT family transporter [Thermodesulfobacteriota bacterium]|nr:DMT family transporter [Thermodesulfobacteriota bacterium]